ncbi:tRNA (guanosine(37)-N1)-methyltransferase TrmD [Cellulomonas sp. NPDC089187]|uniref:tRNA (guanosine(37)-N1)-methyltransferase TrmD n=1 Tax=Cellulomonas sp. NPDC089187 TaxID=3154970 RepID=UPI003445327D
MRIDVVTIFPDYLAPLSLSLVGKARTAGIVDLRVHDLRDWTTDRHRTVDDTPFGGGAGMVMRPDIWGAALDELLGEDSHLLLPTPSGASLTQRRSESIAREDEHLVIACGRYEGIDARVAAHYADRGVRVSEFSLGDYVLNGGEVAALVLIESVVRLLPGVVGNPHSLVEESHGEAGLLEYPVYTKPPVWREAEVPPVLLSGHHGKVERWRRDQALARTAERRPDLLRRLDPAELDKKDRATLSELGWTVGEHGPVLPSPEAVAD